MRSGRPGRAVLAVLGFAFAAALVPAGAAEAHPLGNFTVNSADALRIGPDEIRVDAVTDLAEIPSSQARSELQRLGPDRWRDERCADVASRAELTVDGRALPLRALSADLAFPPGVGGLATTRLVCRLAASADVGDGSRVAFATGGDTSRIGWREITVAGDGTRVQADVPSTSSTRMLIEYPQDLLSSPLDVREATAVVRLGGPAAVDPLTGAVPADAVGARGVDALTSRFSEFVGRQQLGLGLGALALVLSLLLGAAHALAPGHGKTVMAAFLASERGSVRQVSAIGLTVTATHTVGVLLLGVVLSVSATFSPERVYPWLGLLSGLLLVAIGWGLLRSARQRWHAHRTPHHDHDHDHDHGHGHGHHDHHEHDHEHDHPHPPGTGIAGSPVAVLTRPSEAVPLAAPAVAPALTHSHGGRTHSHAPITVRDDAGRPLRTRSLIAMGLAGGLVPSPSALVVLLGAIALQRAWFGVLLVLAYGVGMAATLVGIGALLSRARLRLAVAGTRRSWRRAAQLTAVLPAVTAAVIVVLGAVLALGAVRELL